MSLASLCSWSVFAWLSMYVELVLLILLFSLSFIFFFATISTRSFIIVHVNNKFEERREEAVNGDTLNNTTTIESGDEWTLIFATWFQSMENDPHSTFDVFIYDVYSFSFSLSSDKYVCLRYKLAFHLCNSTRRGSSHCSHLVVFLYNYNSQNHNSAWHYRISCYFIVRFFFSASFIFSRCIFYVVVVVVICISISIKHIIFNYFNVFDRLCLKMHHSHCDCRVLQTFQISINISAWLFFFSQKRCALSNGNVTH